MNGHAEFKLRNDRIDALRVINQALQQKRGPARTASILAALSTFQASAFKVGQIKARASSRKTSRLRLLKARVK